MKSGRSNRIIIIHPSAIIREGLASMIKEMFQSDSLMLEKPENLNNYLDFSDHKIIFLIDYAFHRSYFTKKTEHFKLKNEVKTITINDPQSSSECDPSCNCCFNTHDTKMRLKSLLRPFIDSSPSDARSNHTDLTDREIEVVKLVALGKTNKEIAHKLCISIHTVISHRKNITEKLGIKSISGITVYAILNKFIDANTIDPDALI
jgi:DNA-binding CsgD family transcriptional regulator